MHKRKTGRRKDFEAKNDRSVKFRFDFGWLKITNGYVLIHKQNAEEIEICFGNTGTPIVIATFKKKTDAENFRAIIKKQYPEIVKALKVAKFQMRIKV